MSKKNPMPQKIEPPSIFDDAEPAAAEPASAEPAAAEPAVVPAAVGIVGGKKIESGSHELAAPVRRTGFEFRHTSWGF